VFAASADADTQPLLSISTAILDHPIADHLIDGGCHARIGHRVASAVARAVVRDPGRVDVDVVLELASAVHTLRRRGVGVLDVDVHVQSAHHLQGANGLAVQEQPIQPLEFGGIDRRRVALRRRPGAGHNARSMMIHAGLATRMRRVPRAGWARSTTCARRRRLRDPPRRKPRSTNSPDTLLDAPLEAFVDPGGAVRLAGYPCAYGSRRGAAEAQRLRDDRLRWHAMARASS
jgi:hypothetical protein